jgi:hypothetical protein
MAFSSVLINLLLSIASTEATTSVVRRASIETNGRIRNNRMSSEELEAKRTDLLSSGESSTAVRRDLLWQAVREVDYQFRQKSNCKLEEGTTYAKESMLLAGQTTYSKMDIASARECALMCAADSLDDRSHRNLACKSFTFNKTAHECKFLNFVQQARGTGNKNACCTSGPPCNLDSMREEIQSHFHAELERMTLSHKRQANQQKVARRVEKQTAPNFKQQIAIEPKGAMPNPSAPKIEPERAVPKVEQKVTQAGKAVSKFKQKVALPVPKRTTPKVDAARAGHAVQKVEQKVATHTDHAVPKFEQKVAVPVPEQTVSNVEQKVATQRNHVMPKVDQTVATQTEHAVPKSEQKLAGPMPKHTATNMEQKVSTQPNIEQKVATLAEHAAPKLEQKVAKAEPKAAARVERAMPKVEQKVATHAKHVAPKFEQNVAGPMPKPTVVNVKQKVTTQANHVVPKFEQKIAMTVPEQITPVSSMEKKKSDSVQWPYAVPYGSGPMPFVASMPPMPAPMNPMAAPMPPMTAPMFPMAPAMPPMAAPMPPMAAPMPPMAVAMPPMAAPMPPMTAPMSPMAPPMPPLTAPMPPRTLPVAAPMTPIVKPGATPSTRLPPPAPLAHNEAGWIPWHFLLGVFCVMILGVVLPPCISSSREMVKRLGA